MKILLVMDCAAEFINGVSQSVLNLETGLMCEGHDVRVLMLSSDGRAGIEGNRYLVPSHGFSAIYPGFRFSLRLTRKIRDAILGWKPDIIHSNTEGILYFEAVKLADKTGAKHIHSFHTNFLDFYSRYFPFSKRFSRKLMIAYGNRCFRRMDGVITPSLWGRQIMERFRFPGTHFILPNGIHTEIFSAENGEVREEIRRRYGIGWDEILLVFVGRAAAEKNIQKLISCFCGIRNENVKLMITGGGPELAALKKLAGKLQQNDRIIFTGMIPTEAVAGYYAAADVFVTASGSEVQPLTYVEAMASGLPVVCADAPYIEGLVVNGETGYAFHSREEFTGFIDILVNNPGLRQKMGGNARARVVPEYSIGTFAKSAVRIYSEVLGDGS